MRTCADGSSRPVHNDFRLFVSAKALMPGMEGYLDYASNKLADAALGMEGDVVRSCYAIRLLASAGHVEECIDLFDTSYVIDAVAHGVPWQLLREQAKTTYELACESRNLEKVFKVQLALTTLSQINEHFEYWLERRPFLHLEALVGMDYVVPPLCENTADQYATMLDRCLWLSKEAGCAELSNELYNIWLSGLTPRRRQRYCLEQMGMMGGIGTRTARQGSCLRGVRSPLHVGIAMTSFALITALTRHRILAVLFQGCLREGYS